MISFYSNSYSDYLLVLIKPFPVIILGHANDMHLRITNMFKVNIPVNVKLQFLELNKSHFCI